jgi:hypothetical protein
MMVGKWLRIKSHLFNFYIVYHHKQKMNLLYTKEEVKICTEFMFYITLMGDWQAIKI